MMVGEEEDGSRRAPEPALCLRLEGSQRPLHHTLGVAACTHAGSEGLSAVIDSALVLSHQLAELS